MATTNLDEVLREAVRDAVALEVRRAVREINQHVSACTGGTKLSVAEAAERMGVSVSHAWTLVRSGELRSSRAGKRVLIDPADLPQPSRDDEEAERVAADAMRGAR